MGAPYVRQIPRASAGSWWPFALVVGFLALFFAGVAHLYFSRYRLSAGSEVALYLCLMFLVTLAVIPAFPASRALIEHRLQQSALAAVLVGCCVAVYLIYAFACHDFRWSALLRLLALAGIPPLIYTVAPVRNLAAMSWQDAIVWIWLVLAMVLRKWNGIWNVPVNLDFMTRLNMIVVTSWCWVFLRPVLALGYTFSISMRTVRAIALNFICFALIALPVSFSVHFAAWDPRWRGVQEFGISFAEIFIFIAWLEELLFRGFLQSLLVSTWNSASLGRMVASIAFGFSHILLAPAPNWRYVLLASIAGWFYGAAFRQSGNLAGSSLTHALVDAVWRAWFGGRG